ncbi:hypothetical protein ACS0TY_007577 [Phlomoides rotata]
MALIGSMDQDHIFYTREWTQEVDGVFIRGLCKQTIAGNYIGRGNANRRAILYCKDRVNSMFGTHFEYDTCLDRFRKLYKRYEVFRYIIEYNGVRHTEINHIVTASQETWDAICMVHTLACAYMRKGEKEYDNLCFILTTIPEPPAKIDEMVEVV